MARSGVTPASAGGGGDTASPLSARVNAIGLVARTRGVAPGSGDPGLVGLVGSLSRKLPDILSILKHSRVCNELLLMYIYVY